MIMRLTDFKVDGDGDIQEDKKESLQSNNLVSIATEGARSNTGQAV